MSVKWRFIDPVDSSETEFDVNPNSGGTPTITRTITSRSSLVPGGRTFHFEGKVQPDIISFSGVILGETELDMYVMWFNKLHQVELTDDLGRSFFVFMTEFVPKRVRQGRNYWRHTYDAKLTVVDW